MRTIENKLVTFASPENLDRNGRLFFWDDGVYRAINDDKEPFYRRVLGQKVIPDLQTAGLIGTRPDYHKKFDWYNTENFLECLRKEFSTVEVLPSNPDPRILVLCER